MRETSSLVPSTPDIQVEEYFPAVPSTPSRQHTSQSNTISFNPSLIPSILTTPITTTNNTSLPASNRSNPTNDLPDQPRGQIPTCFFLFFFPQITNKINKINSSTKYTLSIIISPINKKK